MGLAASFVHSSMHRTLGGCGRKGGVSSLTLYPVESLGPVWRAARGSCPVAARRHVASCPRPCSNLLPLELQIKEEARRCGRTFPFKRAGRGSCDKNSQLHNGCWLQHLLRPQRTSSTHSYEQPVPTQTGPGNEGSAPCCLLGFTVPSCTELIGHSRFRAGAGTPRDPPAPRGPPGAALSRVPGPRDVAAAALGARYRAAPPLPQPHGGHTGGRSALGPSPDPSQGTGERGIGPAPLCAGSSRPGRGSAGLVSAVAGREGGKSR